MKFEIIRNKERNTLGWKAEMGGVFYGAYVEFDDGDVTDEKLRLFASSILFFIDYPNNYVLPAQSEPLPLGG